MAKVKTVPWDQADQVFTGLETNTDHGILIQREAIPLVFIPGIMGSRLRKAGTKGNPDLRWDPSSPGWMAANYFGRHGKRRKDLLIGETFSPNFLEVDDSGTFGQGYDGFDGIMKDYCKFLNVLRKHAWGPLLKIFEFPVYAVGYNWTDDAMNAGVRLQGIIDTIRKEAGRITGICSKVILITHSMGGLVARWASEKSGAQSSILGIVHGVQPATGAPAAYWRMKAGFESPSAVGVVAKAAALGVVGGPIVGTIAAKELLADDAAAVAASFVLGYSGPSVTPVLGNIPGGLELLPNQYYRANWLTITKGGETILQRPRQDPYTEIYEVPAVVRPGPAAPSNNDYWGLVDPALLDPGAIGNDSPGNILDALANAMKKYVDPWTKYEKQLMKAKAFHAALKLNKHPHTFCSRGTGHDTAEVIELRVESNWVHGDPYSIRGFRGLFTDSEGNDMQAVLQDPTGKGDGTVPGSSASAVNDPAAPFPGNRHFPVEHQPAYEDSGLQDYTVKAIVALCKKHYQETRG